MAKRKPAIYMNLSRLTAAQVAIHAHTAFQNCGGGGRDFDDALDLTEAGSARTEEERTQFDSGFYEPPSDFQFGTNTHFVHSGTDDARPCENVRFWRGW